MTIVGAARQASIGAESVRRQVVAPHEILFRFLHQSVVNAERRKPGYLERLPDTTRLFSSHPELTGVESRRTPAYSKAVDNHLRTEEKN